MRLHPSFSYHTTDPQCSDCNWTQHTSFEAVEAPVAVAPVAAVAESVAETVDVATTAVDVSAAVLPDACAPPLLQLFQAQLASAELLQPSQLPSWYLVYDKEHGAIPLSKLQKKYSDKT